MSEMTFYKEEDGAYTMEYITGEWFSAYGLTEEDVRKLRAGELRPSDFELEEN